MKKAIVPLLVILLIVVSIFIYINRFSVYYVAEDNSYVFEDDTLASNLTNGVTKDSDEVTVKKVGMSENIYSSNKKYYVGESSKKSVSLDYPIVSEDNSKLYIQTELGKYVDSTFNKSDVMVNSVIADATLYNGVNNVQVDDMSYYFLELNNGVHINLVELTIATSRKTYEIPVNSYIYFGEKFLRYYFRNGKGDFSYREIPAISEVDNIIVGDDAYTYRDFLLLLGVAYVDIVNDGDRNAIEEPTIDEVSQGEDTLKKRGKIIQAERFMEGGEGEGEYYVDPEVHVNSFKANVYSVTFDLDIYDPANRINKPPTLTFMIDGVVYMKKSYSTSGSYIITGLLPDTDYELQVEYQYRNRTNIKYIDKRNRVYVNSQKLIDRGEPYTYPFKTKDISTLNDVVFRIPGYTETSNSVVVNSLSLENEVGDEVLNGIKRIRLHLNDAVVDLPSSTIFLLTKGNSVDYDTKNILESNTEYNCYFEVIDIANNVLRVSNNNFRFTTLKAPPIAVVTAPKTTSKDFTKKKLNIKITNKDDVEVIGDYRVEVVQLVGGVERIVDTARSFSNMDYDFIVSGLEPITKYYVNVYCTYRDRGQVITVKINSDYSFVSGDASALGTISYDAEIEAGSDSAHIELTYTNMSDQDDVYGLLYDYTRVIVKREDTGEIVYDTEEPDENGAYSHRLSKSSFFKFIEGEKAVIDIPAGTLSSHVTYTIQVIPTIQTGTSFSEVKSSVAPSEFTTLKNEAEIYLLNPFKADGYMDFDVCVYDPDGAIVPSSDGVTSVQLNVYNNDKIYFNAPIFVTGTCDDASWSRMTIKDLDPTLDYEFVITANKYNITEDPTQAKAKNLYYNIFKLNGVSGLVNLNKMIDEVAQDLDDKPVKDQYDETQANGANIFDVSNTTRWKGSGSSNSYDMKSLLVDSNIVELGSYQGGYRSYSYYVPELKGKPFTISFYSNVTRSKGSLKANEEFFCINNGYTSGDTCTARSTASSGLLNGGTGNIMSDLITTGANGGLNYNKRFVYTFDKLDDSGYITFFVKDTGSEVVNTTVSLNKLHIEYGKITTHEYSAFGEKQYDAEFDADGNYIPKYVGFFDTLVHGNACSNSVNNIGAEPENLVCGNYDSENEYIDDNNEVQTTEGVTFNEWGSYDYYLRFFIEGNEVLDLRKNITEILPYKDTSELEQGEVNGIQPQLTGTDKDYIRAFLLPKIKSDSSYQVRFSVIASNGGETNTAVEGDASYRFYDIYSYEFTSEIEARSIENENDFRNMHSYGNYVVVNDLDFTNYSGTPFSGTFHGTIDFQGHRVTIATKSGLKYLFGAIGGGARIKNLDLRIIFNNESALSSFHGITDNNYGQILNLMITIKNDTKDETIYANDEDLMLLGATPDKHTNYSWDNVPVKGENDTENHVETDEEYEARYKAFIKRFDVYWTSFVCETNMGLIDKFAIYLKDPVYLYRSSALVVQPHNADGVNQGTIRNGYIYGEDIVSPLATEGSNSRSLAIISTSASKNAVIENIYSLIDIRIYDNNIVWTPDMSHCVKDEPIWKTNEAGEYVNEFDEVITDPEHNGGVFLGNNCVEYSKTRNNNSYTGALVLNSSSNAIVRNIISFGDILGYSDDTYNPADGGELPDGAVSQQAQINGIYTRDSSIPGTVTGSNISNIYNISRADKTYSGAISESINKLYFKDKNFIDEILNTHGAFKTYEAWLSSTYPTLDWPDIMPPQFIEKIDSSRTNVDQFEIMSVDKVEQNSDNFAGSTNGAYSSYFAEVMLSVYTPNKDYRIVGIEIDGINSGSRNSIAVVYGGVDANTNLSIYYLYMREPYLYKNTYTIKNIYYNENNYSSSYGADTKFCGSTNGAPNLPCEDNRLNIPIDLPLYKVVNSFEEMVVNIANETTNFMLGKDIIYYDDDSELPPAGSPERESATYVKRTESSRPYLNEIVGTINGGGHTIKNLDVNNCLIGTLNGTIKDFKVENFTTHFKEGSESYNGRGDYGGLVCLMNNAAVVDGISMKNVNVGAGGSSKIYIGGLVASSKGGFIRNSSIDGFYIKDDNLKYMRNSNAYIGGLVGSGENLIINNNFVRNISLSIKKYSVDTTVEPNVTTWGPKDATAVGGIIGSLGYGNIEDVYTTGDIVTDFNNTGGISGINGGYIKNCISKVNIIGTNYIGTISGAVDDVVVPTSKIAKSLALGDIMSTTSGSNVSRTSGTIIAMNGNYAWDKQSINSVYTSNTDGETLISVSDMLNPLVFQNRIGLSPESWVLNTDYKCPNGYTLSNSQSVCVSDADQSSFFSKGFRYGLHDNYDSEGHYVNSVSFGYLPMLKNTHTGEPLYNQGYYEGEAGYSDATRGALIDLEIRFIEMFTVDGLTKNYKDASDPNEADLSASEQYKADYSKITISFYNPNKFIITSFIMDGMQETYPDYFYDAHPEYFDNVIVDGETKHVGKVITPQCRAKTEFVTECSYDAVPEKFLNSYQIKTIKYKKTEFSNEQDYTVPIKVDLSFYGKIRTPDDWNKVVIGKSQNYLIEKDIDFGCHMNGSTVYCDNTESHTVNLGLSFNVLRGRIKDNGESPKLKNIIVQTGSSNTGLIDNIATSLTDVDFENIYLKTTGSSNYFGLIKTLDGLWQTTSSEKTSLNNIKIEAPNASYVGIVANDRSNLVRDIELNNINVKGLDRTGGFIGYSALKDKINIKMNNIYVVGRNSVGGLVGYEEDAAGRYYDRDIEITGLYIQGNSEVGGVEGRGTVYKAKVTGSSYYFDDNIPGSMINWIKTNDQNKMNQVIGTGSSVGGAIGTAFGNTSSYLIVKNMNISATGSTVGGVIGGSRNIYYSESDHNTVKGSYYVGGIVGSSGWHTDQNLVISNKVEATSHSAGAVAGAVGWTTVSNNQVSVSDDSESTTVKAPHYAGGVVGYFSSSHGTIRDNVTNAVVLTTDATGGAGGVIGYIPNDAETSSDAYRYWVYRNVVTNAVIMSNTTYAGGLIGEWRRDARVDGRIYDNTISASVFCKDTTYCGYINGGAALKELNSYVPNGENNYTHLTTPYNGDFVVSQYYRHVQSNVNHPYAATFVRVKYVCPSGFSPSGEQSQDTICEKITNATVVDHNKGLTDEEDNPLPPDIEYVCPSNTTPYNTTQCREEKPTVAQNVYSCPKGGSLSGTTCNWKYNEYNILYPDVYKNIKINEESVVGKLTGDVGNYSISSPVKLSGTTVAGSEEIRTRKQWSKALNSLTYTSNVTGTGDAIYFPYSSYANVSLAYGGTTVPFPDVYKTKKEYHKPQGMSNTIVNTVKATTVQPLPIVKVYASGVDKINVEFSTVDPSVSFKINGITYNVQRKTYTFYYDFEDDFEIYVTNEYLSETIKVSADEVTNNVVTIGDEYYYIDKDGNVITNGTLKSSGYENKPEEKEESIDNKDEIENNVEEPNVEEHDGSPTDTTEEDSGLVEMSNGNSRGVIYKLVDSSERTTEINNANNIFGDEILLDNKNIYNISTGKTTINDFENLTLVEEDKPLYEFTYGGQKIKTFATYSLVDGEVVNKQLIVKNNKLEILDISYSSSSNSYLVDNYNDKEYVIYLGNDGKIHSLKDQLTLPKGFKNINIKSISSTIGTNTNILLVEYEDGSYVVFNYRTGNIIYNEKSNMSLGEYIKQYLQLTFDDNDYTEENEDYLAAKKLVSKLNKNSIESVLNDNVNTDSSYTTNSTYSIAYNSENNSYSVYQIPLAENSSKMTVNESLTETVDQKIDRNGKLISFYREADSTKVNLVSALLIVAGIVGLIALTVFILARYLRKNQI